MLHCILAKYVPRFKTHPDVVATGYPDLHARPLPWWPTFLSDPGLMQLVVSVSEMLGWMLQEEEVTPSSSLNSRGSADAS